jgi:uncharacterized protein
MFIHEMSVDECHSALRKATIGRLGCALNNQPYVVPVNFAFDGTYLYGFTTLGQKVEWLRSNPLVCFEVDEITGQNDWMSIILFGSYQELPDKVEYAEARMKAYAVLQKRAVWWEPAYISQQHRDQPHSLTPIFYRIHIYKITGQRATPEESETIALTPSKRGWLEKLLDP